MPSELRDLRGPAGCATKLSAGKQPFLLESLFIETLKVTPALSLNERQVLGRKIEPAEMGAMRT